MVKGAPPEVKQITSAAFINKKNLELYKGTGTLELNSGDFDTLGEIPVVEIISGSYAIGEFGLDYGTIVYDYLKQGEDNQIKKN